MTRKSKLSPNDAAIVRDALIDDGWKSPDTYSNCYADIIDGPAVYLFLAHRRPYLTEAVIAYVGMSERLCIRLGSHSVFRNLCQSDLWPMRWFKPVPLLVLRETEAKYITKFDPCLNVIGRKKRVIFS